MSTKWQFERSNGQAQDFGDDIQQAIEKALSNGKTRTDPYVYNGSKYYVDLVANMQYHYPPGSGGCQRKVHAPTGFQRPAYLYVLLMFYKKKINKFYKIKLKKI